MDEYDLLKKKYSKDQMKRHTAEFILFYKVEIMLLLKNGLNEKDSTKLIFELFEDFNNSTF